MKIMLRLYNLHHPLLNCSTWICSLIFSSFIVQPRFCVIHRNLAVVFAPGLSPADGTSETLRVAVACPGPCPSATRGPTGPARPVALLKSNRSGTCNAINVQINSTRQKNGGDWNNRVDRCLDRSNTAVFRLTSIWSFVAFVILAGQTFKQARAEADTLPIQQSQSASVLTRLTLTHIVLCYIVCCGLLQVGNPDVGIWYIQWNQWIDRVWLWGAAEMLFISLSRRGHQRFSSYV